MTPHHHDGELRALAGHPVLELTPSEIHTADLCVEVVRVTIFARELQHDYLVNVDVSPVVLGFLLWRGRRGSCGLHWILSCMP